MLFSPGTVVANELPQPETAGSPKTTETPPASANPGSTPDPKPAVDQQALLDAINADREKREKLAREQVERDGFKKRAEEAEAKLEAIERAKKNRLLDPAGFLRKMGYTDRELALTSEGIMFSLMPDKAPASHIANLVKAQREQDEEDRLAREKSAEEATKKREAEAKTAHERDIEARYHASLKREVAALKPGTFPAAQAWYADDHDGFAQELFDTASKLAEAAVKAGNVIDVSAAAIAQHVEKKYADRAKRLAGVFSPATSTPPTTQPPKPQIEATSLPEEKPTKPVVNNHKLSEKEIIQRAAAAAFGARP